jgi:hypothetical protein
MSILLSPLFLRKKLTYPLFKIEKRKGGCRPLLAINDLLLHRRVVLVPVRQVETEFPRTIILESHDSNFCPYFTHSHSRSHSFLFLYLCS